MRRRHPGCFPSLNSARGSTPRAGRRPRAGRAPGRRRWMPRTTVRSRRYLGIPSIAESLILRIRRSGILNPADAPVREAGSDRASERRRDGALDGAPGTAGRSCQYERRVGPHELRTSRAPDTIPWVPASPVGPSRQIISGDAPDRLRGRRVAGPPCPTLTTAPRTRRRLPRRHRWVTPRSG